MIYPEDFDKFYRSPSGKASAALILNVLEARWSDLRRKSLLSLGYATPYLDAFLGKAKSVTAFMPGFQGGVAWPRNESSLLAIVDPARLPLRDNAIDRILVVHLLEFSDDSHSFLKELQRVLSPEGRIIIVAPSLWGATRSSRWDAPFGAARGYSLFQIKNLLRRAGLAPIAVRKALYAPFITVGEGCAACERIAAFFRAPFASVHIVEAEKRTAHPIPGAKTQCGHGVRFRPATMLP